MFGVKTRFTATPNRLARSVNRGARSVFGKTAYDIRRSAIESIERRKKHGKPAPPGQPIRTKSGRGGGLAKRAILYKADEYDAVIGFAASRIDTSMQVHEHGGARGGVTFPPRPTMAPALKKNLARFHKNWEWALK